MRLCFLTSTPLTPTEGSGTFVGIQELQRALTGLGHAVTVRGLEIRSGFHTFDRWLYNMRVRMKPPAADLVTGFDLDGFLWARHRRTRFVASLKGIIADELRNERGLVRVLLGIQARWERRNVRLADRVIVTSRYCAEVARREYGVPESKLAVVPELIDLEEWDAWFARVSRRPADRPVLLCVARLYPRKRVQDLLEAVYRLRRRIPDLQLRVVGRGPEWSRLLRLRSELGLEDTVLFLGEISRRQLAQEYLSADCFCLPSVQEGFGIVFLEAMAAGKPVVACRTAAVPEVVPDGKAGILVPPRSPDDLAIAIERTLSDPRMAKEWGETGRQWVRQFAAPRVAARFLEAAAA
ncbi:MAG: glycosyltransferase family 4 protein [candidate division NC10 bacterium]